MCIPGRGNPGGAQAGGDLPCVLEEQGGGQWLEQISDEESCNCLAVEGRRRERRDTNIIKSHECEAKESLGLKEILDV